MSDPTVSIYASIELARSKIVEQFRDEIRKVKSVAASESKGLSLRVPVELDVKPETWAKLQAKLAGMKLTIPVHLAPVGGMPGMPGGGTGATVAVPGGGSSSTAFDPRKFWLSYYGRQQTNIKNFPGMLAGAIEDADDKYAEAVAADNARRAAEFSSGRGGPGGRRGGMSPYLNPFSPRGVARLVGSGVGVYAGLEAIRLATGFVEAGQTAAHPERFLREMDKIGASHSAYADQFMQGQASSMAGASAHQDVVKTMEGVPLLGSLWKLMDAIDGTSKSLEDLERNVKDVTAIHESAQKQSDESRIREASLTGNPLKVLAAKQRSEAEADDAADRHAYEAFSEAWEKHGPIDPRTIAAKTAMHEQYSASRVHDKLRTAEAIQAVKQEGGRHGLSANEATYAFGMAGVYHASGDPMEVMRLRQKAETDKLYSDFETKIGEEPDEVKKEDLRKLRQAKMTEADAKNAQEKKQLIADLDKQERDSILQIAALRDSANEQMLRSAGQAYQAEIEASRNATRHKIDDLESEAVAAEKVGNKRVAEEKRALKAAEEASGAAAQRALIIEHARQGAIAAQRSNSAFAEDTLEAGGHNRAARDARLDADYREKVQDIMNRHEPDMMAQLHAAAIGYAGQKVKNNRGDALSDRSLANETADFAARAQGQDHVGEVLQMGAEFQDMEANADTPERKAAVRKYEEARIAAMRRGLRPTSHTFGLAEYHDALQDSITSGMRNDHALNLLDAQSKMGDIKDVVGKVASGALGGPFWGGAIPGGPNDPNAKMANAIVQALKDNSRQIGIFKRP